MKERFRAVKRWLIEKPWPGLTMVVAAATFVGYHLSGSTPPPGAPRPGLPWWLTVLLVLALFVFIVGVLSLVYWNERRQILRNPDDRHRQIRELAAALEKSVTAIEVIRSEVEYGERLLSDLELRTNVQREISNLTSAEALAVRDALRTELRTESRRGLLRDIVLGLFFFLLGTGAVLLLHR